MKTRDKNPVLKEQIGRLHALGRESPALKAIAKELNSPTRSRRRVNIKHLEKTCKTKETIVVPGSVLGEGELTKALNVYALSFSRVAEEKIKKAGGACLSMGQLIEQQPKKIRIIG